MDILCGEMDTQELTDGKYFADPFYHDKRNMRNLRMYFG